MVRYVARHLTVDEYIKAKRMRPGDYLFESPRRSERHITTRQYARTTLDRATVRQKKTGHSVRFEITEPTREAVDEDIKTSQMRLGSRESGLRSRNSSPLGCRIRECMEISDGQRRSIRRSIEGGALP